MNDFFLLLAAGSMVVTAAVHSLLGERRLVVPLLALERGVAAHPLARFLLRFAWHLTSILMLLVALTLLLTDSRTLVAVIGAAHVAVGLLDAVGSRGRHIGWPALTASGAFALLALL